MEEREAVLELTSADGELVVLVAARGALALAWKVTCPLLTDRFTWKDVPYRTRDEVLAVGSQLEPLTLKVHQLEIELDAAKEALRDFWHTESKQAHDAYWAYVKGGPTSPSPEPAKADATMGDHASSQL